jgi:potassium-transporting ATPase potassium-binding subunit
MTFQGWALIIVFAAIVVAITKPLGAFLFALYEGRRTPLHTVLGPIETGFYKLAGIDPNKEQGWRDYALSVMLFSAFGIVSLYALLRLQAYLPLNPTGMSGVAPDLAFNTAVSFITNTNWQSYAGESTMSHLSQMAGLTVHNFLSAAAGIAVAFAVIRGFARREAKTLGNFWADMTRVTLYALLPISILLALLYVAMGIPQTLAGTLDATTLEGAHQAIGVGPVASQIAIKMLGTNGGGFFNANAAHPFEDPTALCNLIQMISIFALGAGLTWTFGKAVGNTRQGWALLAAMGVLFFIGVTTTYWAEALPNPIHAHLGLNPAMGNMEGKEVRFGIAASALFATVTTDASCGAVIAMHDSLSAIGGLVPMFNMHLGEIIVGGVGSGLYGMLLFAILAVFVAGLMVGRTPEYVGKKIESREVKLAMLAMLVLPLATLGLAAVASVLPAGLAGPLNKGPHGFSEILYAFSSAAANNGSAFAGLTASTPFYDGLLAVGMFLGRFFMIVPMLAVAGSLAGKRHTPQSAGSFPTTGTLWVALLVGVILIIGGLTYLPSLVLGPGADQAAVVAGTLS